MKAWAWISIQLIRIGILAAMILVWFAAAYFSTAISFNFGSPGEVFREFYELLTRQQLVRHAMITGLEAFGGLMIGTLAGSILGLLLWYSERTADVVRLYIVAIGAVPVFAFAPMMIIWFGVGITMKIALATIPTFFVSLSQAYQGAKEVNKAYVEVLTATKATRRQIFHKIIIPGSIDAVLESLKLNVNFALLGAFIGEFITSDRGLGYLILKSAGLYNIPRLAFRTFLIVAVGIFFEFV